MWRHWISRALGLVCSASLIVASNQTYAERKSQSPHPKLISHSQMLKLSRSKRKMYLMGVAGILATIEQQQKNYRVAGLGTEFEKYERLHAWLSDLRVWSVAQAAATTVQVPVWNSSSKSWYCPATGVTFSSNVGTCVSVRNVNGEESTYYPLGGCSRNTVPVASSQWQGRLQCIPYSSWNLLGFQRKEDLSTGNGYLGPSVFAGKSKLATKKYVDPELKAEAMIASSQKSTSLLESASGKEAPVSNCEAAEIQCSEMTEEERNAGIQRFRAVTGSHATCITGGFFSQYKKGRERKAGGCEIRRNFPSETQKTLGCDNGTALCNPVLFCHGQWRDVQSKLGGKTQAFLPIKLCVTVSQNITRDCQAEFDRNVKVGKIAVAERGQSDAKVVDGIKACDSFVDPFRNFDELTQTDQEVNMGIKEAWDEIASGIEQHYLEYCMNDREGCDADGGKCPRFSNFRSLFCAECEIIGKRIAELNKSLAPDTCEDVRKGPATQGREEKTSN